MKTARAASQKSLTWTWARAAKDSLPERSLAALAIDCIDALRQGKISVADIRDSGLSAKTYRTLKAFNADPRLLEMLEWAMELSNVERIVPNGLSESLEHIEKLAREVLTRPRKSAPSKQRGFRGVSPARRASARSS